jgi:predicted DNA-binding protein
VEGVLHFEQTRSAITVRLPDDLAEWLRTTARRTGLPQGRIIREQLDKVRHSEDKPFLRLAGTVKDPASLSMRKGYSKK